MEVIFPQDTGYAGMFFVGARKNAAGATERTGTVVLKRTYAVAPLLRALLPAAEPLPVFMQDQPDNLVENGDFEMSQADFAEPPNSTTKPGRWSDAASVGTLAPGQGVAASKAVGVTGVPNGRVAQTLVFEKPLGGRGFAFSFSAKADTAPTNIVGAQLEAEGTGPICVVNATLGAALNRFPAAGVWPAGVAATEMRVVLPVATNAARTVFYDAVQVEERLFVSRWDPHTTPRYEHDLAAFKPRGDLIVLGFTNLAGVCRARVNGVVWMERTLPAEREKAMFGWEPRTGGPREVEMGVFSSNPADYPLADPLPAAFRNSFYNGYSRVASQLTSDSYFAPRADILIERAAGAGYRFTLGGEEVNATLYHYRGDGPDEEESWAADAVAFNLDTLVVEPDADRCYAVWRGVWPYESYSESSYRRLVVTA